MSAAWKNKLLPSVCRRTIGVSKRAGVPQTQIGSEAFKSSLQSWPGDCLRTSHKMAVDTSCHKAGGPDFPGCVEHSSGVLDPEFQAGEEQSPCGVAYLNNAYGSVPQKLIQSVFMSLNQSSPWYHLLLQRLPGVFYPPGLCSRTSPIGSMFCFGVFHHPSSFHCSL